MRRFTVLMFCLVALSSLGFWRLTATPKPLIHVIHAEESRRPRDQRPEPEQLEKHLEQLLHDAEELGKAGKAELALKVRQEAEQIERHLHEMREDTEGRSHRGHRHHPEYEGGHQHERGHHFAEAEERLEHLIHAAENLDRAGKHEMAEELRHEAEGIERDLHHARQQEHGHHGQPSLEPVMHELKNLRREVAELREQIQALRKELHVTMKKRVQTATFAPPKTAPTLKLVPDAPQQPAKAKPPKFE